MFDMALPWWEFVVRGTVVYLVLLLMVRISGRRTVGQFTPFDLLVVMLLSEAVSNSLVGGDESLIGGLIIAAVLMGLKIGRNSDSIRQEVSGDLRFRLKSLTGPNDNDSPIHQPQSQQICCEA